MRPERLLLRFDDRQQAAAVLGAIGIAFDAVSGDGIMRRLTGEMAEFEGEVVALTCPVSGYHVSLVWYGDPPHVLAPYVVPKMVRKEESED